jgi:hypothetical protein
MKPRRFIVAQITSDNDPLFLFEFRGTVEDVLEAVREARGKLGVEVVYYPYVEGYGPEFPWGVFEYCRKPYAKEKMLHLVAACPDAKTAHSIRYALYGDGKTGREYHIEKIIRP